jgi:glycosyltransferase involved in cell wall biosynthesis
VLLWFTHWRTSRLLQVAERLSNAVVTVDARTFPLASEKVVAIGHGVDLAGFECTERPAGTALRLLVLGRTSPAKGIVPILRAVALTPDARVDVVGPSLTAEERTHREELRRLVTELGLGERARIGEAVPRDRVPELLAGADVLVNNMRPGATDKVVYEAAATCLPVLASNPAFDDVLPPELRFPTDDVDVLARRIDELAAADRAGLGRRLRAAVEERHAVDGWAARLVGVGTR